MTTTPGGGLCTPQSGDRFDLFVAETISGSFDVLKRAMLGGGMGRDMHFLVDEIGRVEALRFGVIETSSRR